MKNIVLIGPPGAGKGTQAKMLCEKFELIHISTGDLIREEQANNTKIGKLATELIDKGHYLPDNIVISMVKQKIIDNPKTKGFVFDGFPRTLEQAKVLDDFMFTRKTPIDNVIMLNVNDDVVRQRINERSKKENRVDDKPEVIKTRIETYKKQTHPVLEYYKTKLKFSEFRKFTELDASKPKEEVLSDLESLLV